MSPDTVSSLFPDRPIRPLPKRRIREKLSPGVADSIKYPPSTHESAPLFYYPPYTLKEEETPPRAESKTPPDQARRGDAARNYTPRQNGLGLSDGDEEETNIRSTLITRSPPEILTRATRHASRSDQSSHTNPQPPPSTTSSVDGYDSFENTNNKKKRKIPSAGDPSLSPAHALNNEITLLSISAGAIHSSRNELHGDRPYAHPGGHPSSGTFSTSSQGISGSGRGRLGRSRSGRSPLRALSDGNGSWTGRNPKAASPQWASKEQASGGIISNAIANAERLRPQRQENVSLLHQHTSTNKPTPASTQFTFTCDSQVPGTVQWPGHSTRHSMGMQTGPGMSPSLGSNGMHDDASTKATSGGSRDSRRKNQQRLERELNVAARHRRQLAAESNHHNPPKISDIWICEFCEYERIFGEPPRALIRDYEIKDRRHRQEEADRKRLLEKAKAKSRKGRKSGKTPARGGQAAVQTMSQAQVDLAGDPGNRREDSGHHHSTQFEDDDYVDEFEDEYSNAAQDIVRRVDDRPGDPLPQLIKA